MAGSNPESRHRRLADQWPALLAEPDMLWKIARLLRLDGRGTEDGADGADVGDDVVALSLVELYLIGRVW